MNTVRSSFLLSSLGALSILAVLTLLMFGSSPQARPRRMSQNVTLNKKDCHNKRLLVISFDGFRWNYLNRTETPNFDKFIRNGVQARNGLKNAFTSTTLPNHFTLATGLWEESHQIVASIMYDPVLNATFNIKTNTTNEQNSAWVDVGGEPVWVTNQLYGGGHSGIIMWFGGGARIHGVSPTKEILFKYNFKNETKIETMINWFNDDCRMNLGMIYFPQPDIFGHWFGPESEQVTGMIGGLDELVGFLLKRLEEEGLLNNTNIILTSDHGFASAPLTKLINLDEIIDPQSYSLTSISPVAGFWPKPGYFDEIYTNLTSAAAHNENFTVYKREDIPEHYHYKHSRRVPPIIAVADEHYSFRVQGFNYDHHGDHGYDNRLVDMRPFFLAMGPDFKSGFSVDSFHNVDLYSLMCHLLGVRPSPNNGSMDIVASLLKSPGSSQEDLFSTNVKYLLVIISVSCLLVVAAATIVVYVRCYAGKFTRVGKSLAEEEEEEEDSVIYAADSTTVPLL